MLLFDLTMSTFLEFFGVRSVLIKRRVNCESLELAELIIESCC